MLVKVTIEYMAHVQIGGGAPGYPDNSLPGGGGRPDNALPTPPIYFPGRPDQGLPPVLGWPVDPGYGRPVWGGRPDQGLPGYGHPDQGLPPGGVISPPIFYPPDGERPPVVGWPMPPEIGENPMPTPPIYIPGDGTRPPVIGWPLPPAPVRPDQGLPGERPNRPEQGLPGAPARPGQGLPPAPVRPGTPLPPTAAPKA